MKYFYNNEWVDLPFITKIKTINNQNIIGEGNLEIGGAVDSVNGKTGTVVLKTSDLENDNDYVTKDWVLTYVSESILGGEA